MHKLTIDYIIEEILELEDVWLEDDEKTLRQVASFCCGPDNPLNTFLQSEAFYYNKDGQGNTYLVKERSTVNIVAYYTLKTNAIQIYNEEYDRVESLASIELARFAVDHQYQNQLYGRLIFTYCIIPKVESVRNIVGVNNILLFVDENNTDAIRFYKRLGFTLGSDEVKKFIQEDFSENCNVMYVLYKDSIEYFEKAKEELKITIEEELNLVKN